jgi:hypothetical protein
MITHKYKKVCKRESCKKEYGCDTPKDNGLCPLCSLNNSRRWSFRRVVNKRKWETNDG